MADDTIPQDLVAARRDFLAADAQLTRLAAEAPSAIGTDGTIVGADPQYAALMAAQRAAMRDLAEQIAGHEWMTASGDRFSNWQKVDSAAKAAD